jgi:hypothetical protein
MASNASSSKVVVVTGDVTVDWNITTSSLDRRQTRTRRMSAKTFTGWQPGGAALLADLVEKTSQLLSPAGETWSIRQTDIPRQSVCPNDPAFNHSFAIWMEKEKKIKDKEKVWRVEAFLGLQQADLTCQDWMKVVQDTPDASLVVLDDADLYFRKFPELIPVALRTPAKSPWVLLKASGRVATGPLWKYLVNNHAERLIVLAKAEDLRKIKAEGQPDPEINEVQVSRDLSWEAAVEDLIWEITNNPTLKDLQRCAHLVVSFGTGGAVLISRDLDTPGKSLFSTNTLIYDPFEIESSWDAAYPGFMIAGETCLAASLAHQVMLNTSHPNLKQGVMTGLYARRLLHEKGFLQVVQEGCGPQLQFPFKLVAEALAKKDARFAEIEVYPPTTVLAASSIAPDPEVLRLPYWTILGEINQKKGQGQEKNSLDERENILALSQQIVLNGIEVALKNVPIGKFRDLVTVDRREIEGFRSIRTLISEYSEKDNPGRPLSIAVFGAPGAGKSFGIREVANSISTQIEERTFNLSQFASEADIKDALHQVRDIALSGKIPLIFWDEFDTSFQSQALGWLRFFLAPMQDGNFQDGQITHPIGRCIFIFAGGTCSTMEAFKNRETEEERSDEQKKKDRQDFKAAKGPDFISRLKGFINIMGPNPQRQPGDSLDQAENRDPYFQIRRAVLIRSMFARKYKNLIKGNVLQIDRGLLKTMLKVPEYTHGARSIESIIEMSTLSDKDYFDRSSLPVPALLNLHASAELFMKLLQSVDLKDEDRIERMAKAVHEIFCHQRRKEGYIYGKEYSEAEKTHPALLDYDDPDLDESYRIDSRKNAADIEVKLTRLGYSVRQARSSVVVYQFSADEIEKMAHWEHNRWMISKLIDGWKWAPKTDRLKKENHSILLWNKTSLEIAASEFSPTFSREEMTEFIRNGTIGSLDFPESEKEMDRNLVRDIPIILAKAGLRIQKI